jgi:hypothetical protein
MILYKTPAGVWTGTQADARAAARDETGDPKNWVEINVPVDKAGLMEFLNEHRVGAVSPEPLPQEDPRNDDPEVEAEHIDYGWGLAELEPELAKPKPASERALDRTTFAPLAKTADEVVTIIHEADHADLSNYFEAVIYRAKELQP